MVAQPESQAGRKSLAKQGKALPGGSYPVPNLAYLKKAIRAKGRTDPSKWPALKRLLRKRARELGATGAAGVKGTWIFEGSQMQPQRVIDLVGPHGFVHGWIKVDAGEAAKYNGKQMRGRLASGKGVIVGRYNHSNGTITRPGTGMTHKVTHIDPTAYEAGFKGGSHLSPDLQRRLASSGPTARSAGGKRSLAAHVRANVRSLSRPMDLAGALPVVSSSDGPRVTTMAGPATTAASGKLGLPPHQTKAYAKLRGKGMPHALAMKFAKRVKKKPGQTNLARTSQTSNLLPQSAGKYGNWYSTNTGTSASTNQASALLPQSAGRSRRGGGLKTGSALLPQSAGGRYAVDGAQASKVTGPQLRQEVAALSNLHPKVVAAYATLRKKGIPKARSLAMAKQFVTMGQGVSKASI